MKTTFKHLLVAAVASFALVGCATKHGEPRHEKHVDHGATAQWEYRTEHLRQDDRGTATRLNELNSEGWELVSVSQADYYSKAAPGGGLSTYTFKRLKQ